MTIQPLRHRSPRAGAWTGCAGGSVCLPAVPGLSPLSPSVHCHHKNETVCFVSYVPRAYCPSFARQLLSSLSVSWFLCVMEVKLVEGVLNNYCPDPK